MIRFTALTIIASLGIGLLWVQPVTALSVAVFTAYYWTVIYGITYYQVRMIMRLFRKRRS